MLTHTVVSTEDAEIEKVSRDLGMEVVPRPMELAGDSVPTLPVIEQVLAELEPVHGRYDFVVILQVTTPLRIAEDIDASIKMAIDTGAESVIGVVRVLDHHPSRVKKITKGRLEDYIPEEDGSRRQDLSPAYVRNGAVYVCRRDLIDRGSLRGKDRCPYEMPAERSINIDEKLDFMLAEIVMKGGLEERFGA